jgi:hypothetical protein
MRQHHEQAAQLPLLLKKAASDTYNLKGADSAAERFGHDCPDQQLREIMVEVVRLACKVRNTRLIFQQLRRRQGPAQRASRS